GNRCASGKTARRHRAGQHRGARHHRGGVTRRRPGRNGEVTPLPGTAAAEGALAMNVDREIAAALNVDPSPEFVARVRMRVASEPQPRRWVASGLLAALAAAAVVVAALVVGRWAIEPTPKEQILAATRLSGLGSDVFPLPHPGPGQPSPRLRRSARALAGVEGLGYEIASRGYEVASPDLVASREILIDPREAAAIRRLLAGVGQGRIDLKPVFESSPFVVTEVVPVEDL